MSDPSLQRVARVLRNPRDIDRVTVERAAAKAKRVATRAMSRRLQSPAEVRSPDDPKVLFRPATGEWYVPHDGRWFEPESEADLDELLARLPLEVIDERELASERSRGGVVRVVPEGSDAMLEFVNTYGDRVRRAANGVPGGPRVSIERGRGFHEDGWVETVASMRLDGARKCWLEAFLPDTADGDKHLAVVATIGHRTTVDVHLLVRGEITRVPLYSSRRAARSLRVRLETSVPEPVDEERELGFVASSIEALA